MPIVVSGRYHLQRNHNSSLHLSHPSVTFVSTKSHSEYQAHWSTSRNGCQKSCLDMKVSYALVFGKDQKEHDKLSKMCFRRSQPKFLHHIIDQEGIRADPDKTSTITEMKPPTNVSKLGCFMGMDNQLGKFSSSLAELSGNSSTRSHLGF